jgi:hypothetical protein
VLDFEDASSPTSLSVESGAEPSAGADEEPDAASRRRLPKISGFPVSLHAAAARPIVTENSPCEPLEVLGRDALRGCLVWVRSHVNMLSAPVADSANSSA